MEDKKLQKMIDEYGSIKDQIKSLTSKEKILSAELLKTCETASAYYGEKYEIKVIEIVNTKLSPHKVFKYLKNLDKFLSIVSISKTDAKTLLLDNEIEKLSVETEGSKRLTYKKL